MAIGDALARGFAVVATTAYVVLATGVAGCGTTLQALGERLQASERYRVSVQAEFDVRVVVRCVAAREERSVPCGDSVALTLTNVATREVGVLELAASEVVGGALREGLYDVGVRIDGMQMGLSFVVGQVSLREGRQALGTLEVRFVELPGGSVEDVARAAERERAAYGLEAADFVHSPERGLLLADARLGGST